MRAVVDTNVWVSGLIVPGGTPGRVLDAVRRGDLEPVASWELARELAEVLRRPEIRRYGVTEADVDDVLAVLGPLLPDVDVEVEVRDPDDAVVVGAALAGAAEVIVSGDHDLLDNTSLGSWLAARGIELLTQAELLGRLDQPLGRRRSRRAARLDEFEFGALTPTGPGEPRRPSPGGRS